MLSKNRKWCNDLKIAYGVKGFTAKVIWIFGKCLIRRVMLYHTMLYLFLYPIITPFGALKYIVFENFIENGAFALLEQMLYFPWYFQKYSKLSLKFSWIFSMLSKNRKWFNDLKIAYGVKGYTAKVVKFLENGLIRKVMLYHTKWSISLYSIITPFGDFEIYCIWKYYWKWSICSFGANALFSIIFS